MVTRVNNDFTLKVSLFGAVKTTDNADPDKKDILK